MKRAVESYMRQIWRRFKEGSLSLEAILKLRLRKLDPSWNEAVQAAQAWAREKCMIPGQRPDVMK